MAPEVHVVRASPRWPAADERFDTGWDGLACAAPLLDALVAGAGDAADAAIADTLRDAALRIAGPIRTVVLLLVPEDGSHHPRLLLRQLGATPGLAVADTRLEIAPGDALAPAAHAALRHLLAGRTAVECPLPVPPGADRPAGWLLASCDDAAPDAVAAWSGRARTTLESIAWVLDASLHGGGWDAWTTRPGWPALDEAGRTACREARDAARRAAAPPPAPAAAERVVDENVQFTVYRPRRLPTERWCPVLAFAHLAERRADAPDDAPDPIEEVRRQARQALGDAAAAYADTTQDSGEAIPRDGEITFVLDLPGLSVNPPSRSFRWLEDVHREEFRIRAPAPLDGQTVRGALHVYLGALVVADVRLAVRVDAAAAEPEPDDQAEHARPYRRIFPSYSHRDEAIVRQVEAYARTMGDEYLRDVTHLRAGEVWNDRLLEFIRTADVFQLFWSRNSMRSPWVRQEWEFALSLARPHFVRPTYWETPLPAAPEQGLPPASLRDLHFQRLPIAPPAGGPAGGMDPATAGAPAPPPAVPPPAAAPEASYPPTSPRRRRFHLPTTLAALFLVGMIGGSLMLQQGRLPAPLPPPAIEPQPEGPGPGGGKPTAPRPGEPRTLSAVSPDGMVVASMDADGRIRIASRTGGEPLVIATKFRPPDVAAMRFSADGARIVCELRDGSVVEWDARTGARLLAAAPDRGGYARRYEGGRRRTVSSSVRSSGSIA